MAQAFAADALYEVGASAIQVFGGVGFTWEHDIHLFYKRLLTLQQHAGGAMRSARGAGDDRARLRRLIDASSGASSDDGAVDGSGHHRCDSAASATAASTTIVGSAGTRKRVCP